MKIKINGNFSGFHRVALSSTVSRSNWNLEMLIFADVHTGHRGVKFDVNSGSIARKTVPQSIFFFW